MEPFVAPGSQMISSAPHRENSTDWMRSLEAQAAGTGTEHRGSACRYICPFMVFFDSKPSKRPRVFANIVSVSPANGRMAFGIQIKARSGASAFVLVCGLGRLGDEFKACVALCCVVFCSNTTASSKSVLRARYCLFQEIRNSTTSRLGFLLLIYQSASALFAWWFTELTVCAFFAGQFPSEVSC